MRVFKLLLKKIFLNIIEKNLFNLNQKLSSEANNLASAIKGDYKYQGRWGEIILEKLKSGPLENIFFEALMHFF